MSCELYVHREGKVHSDLALEMLRQQKRDGSGISEYCNIVGRGTSSVSHCEALFCTACVMGRDLIVAEVDTSENENQCPFQRFFSNRAFVINSVGDNGGSLCREHQSAAH